ncbi:PilC/PilY family type IV pilus protein [Cocleimonas flava]|uniref:Tfp pilus tip-associated adhesin PilY1 n=1 Tax=Cocleimonas flava TaxID=634765 RepID=A0A4R1EWV3_9GAMM|nr:PilC/PilY family type IV pilus protein [Cocleimonas flava]TCJ85270.1 Tfp pilus tip-associated adhesin PilY1 [Cocleimonas flava]
MNKLTNKISTAIKTALSLSMLASCITTYAEDTEVFYSVNVSKPNLLFVLDVSGSMSGTIEVSSGPGTAVTSQIKSSVEDGSQNGSNSNVVTNQNSITFSQYNLSRFRFDNLGIPQDANITDAYIQFESAATTSGDVTVRVYSDDTNNSPSSDGNYFSGNFNRGYDWEIREDWAAGDRTEDQRVDVMSVLQEVVDRNGWQQNNGVSFFLYNVSGGSRSVFTFDDNFGTVPELHVEYTDGSSYKKKIDVMKESLRTVLEEAPDNVKIGLMNYGQEGLSIYNPQNKRHNSVSGIAFPVTDINAKARDVITSNSDVYGLPSFPDENKTVREYVADIADSWNENSFTPIVDALYEAALYYRGETMHYGQNSPYINGAHPTTYSGDVVTKDIRYVARDVTSSNAQKYISPIESSCQENYIVLMTDGAPTYRVSYNNSQTTNEGPFASIRGTSKGPQGTLASAIGACASPQGAGNAGKCGAEITQYIATHDNLPDPTGSFPNGQEGNQYIETFTIGFGTGAGTSTETYLKSLATYDDGIPGTEDDGYFEASSPEALANAFKNILAAVAAPKGTLASPGYSVNVKSGLEHEKDIYIPVFDRKNSSRWAGNLKKFKIVDEDGLRKIKGSNGAEAVDELGGFTTNALDYWSESPAATPDGKLVQKGGLANLLDPSERNVYSDIVSNDISTASNQLTEGNIANITNDVLGISPTSTVAYRKKLVNFMRGWELGEPNTEARYHMGDMLHSEPLVITYNSGENGVKKQYIFAGTNEGYLHAFDTADTGSNAGKEMFAFIPSELLKTITESQYLNEGTAEDHKYGVDGSITYWFNDVDEDGVVDVGSDQVILYFGLRRGGNSYYALDVTNINAPKLLWKVNSEDTGYGLLGQSWSPPYLARVGVDGSTCVNGRENCKEVVIISGGYDPDEDRNIPNTQLVDDAKSSVTANEGNDIFIIDAINGGAPLWKLSSAVSNPLVNSVPGGIRILDTNYNQFIDRMYFGDTGGNLWRVDLSEAIGSSDEESTITKLAELGDGGRKFFNEPDVSALKLKGKTVFAVSIGSGFRAHPLDKTIDDKFYVVLDRSPFSKLDEDNYNTILTSTLARITIDESGVTQTGTLAESDGWLVHLPDSGEKVLATAVTFDGVITFTTLVPEVLTSGVGIDQCAAPATQGRFYAINLLTGEPGIDLDGSGDDDSDTSDPYNPDSITDNDIYITVAKGEIPGKPQTIFNPLDVVAGVCTHPVDIRIGKKLSQATGYDACRLESVYWSDPVSDQ